MAQPIGNTASSGSNLAAEFAAKQKELQDIAAAMAASTPASQGAAPAANTIPQVTVPNPFPVGQNVPANNPDGTGTYPQITSAINNSRINAAGLGSNTATTTAATAGLPVANTYPEPPVIDYIGGKGKSQYNFKQVPPKQIREFIATAPNFSDEERATELEKFNSTMTGLSAKLASQGITFGKESMLPLGQNKPADIVTAYNDPMNSESERMRRNAQTDFYMNAATNSILDLPLGNNKSAVTTGADSRDPNSARSQLAAMAQAQTNTETNLGQRFQNLTSGYNPDGTEKGFIQGIGDAMNAQRTRAALKIVQDMQAGTFASQAQYDKSLADAIKNNAGMYADPKALLEAGTLGVNQQNSNIQNTAQDINRASQQNTAVTTATQVATIADNAATARAQLLLEQQKLALEAQKTNLVATGKDENPNALIRTDPDFARILGDLGVTVGPNTTLEQIAGTTEQGIMELARARKTAKGNYGNDILSAVNNADNASATIQDRAAAAKYKPMIAAVTQDALANNAEYKQLAEQVEDVKLSDEQRAVAGQKANALLAQLVQGVAVRASQGDQAAIKLSSGLYGGTTDPTNAKGALKNGGSYPAGVTPEMLKNSTSPDIVLSMRKENVPLNRQAQFFRDVAASSVVGTDYGKFAAPNAKTQGALVFIKEGQLKGTKFDLGTEAGVAQYTAWLLAEDAVTARKEFLSTTSVITAMFGGTRDTVNPQATAARRIREQGGSRDAAQTAAKSVDKVSIFD